MILQAATLALSMRASRALLREWHPDKHEDKDLATAVFQSTLTMAVGIDDNGCSSVGQ
jgi:hypothetical protein